MSGRWSLEPPARSDSLRVRILVWRITMNSIVDLVRDAVTPELVRKMSGVIGEPQGSTETAMGAVVPALLGGVADKAATPAGAERIHSLITEGGFGAGMLEKLGGLLGGGSGTDNLLRTGSSLVSGLFGDKAGGITETIAGLAGIGRGSAGSLLSLAAPLVMSVLGKQIALRGLDAAGLMSMLMGQRSAIASALPTGLGHLIGAKDYGAPRVPEVERIPASPTVRDTSRYVAEEPAYREPERRASPSWLWPAIALGGLALLGTLFLIPRRAPDVAVRAPAPPAVQAPAPAATPPPPVAQAPAPEAPPAALPRQAAVSTPPGLLDQVSSYLKAGGGESKRFVFDNLNFDTGSTRLTAASRETVDELGALLKAHPSAQIKVEGFTDNVGSAAANRQLARRRAETVKQMLVQSGVEPGRIQTEGLGPDRPVASNDTPEGRARNRRTELVVSVK
jgi:outer membrane protein OmpA-like peptidoglycan-associated protein